MNYRDYQNARDAAWRLLLDTQTKALPVQISGICRTLGIRVSLYDAPEDGNDGISLLLDDHPFIFVSNSTPRARQRFTAAHELGHILLGHVGQYELVNREPGPGDSPIEQAANVFASRLLAPACVLWGCGARTPEEIMRLCDISRQAAEFRAQRMKVLYRRNIFLASPLERQVYHQFADYIATHKL